ncbi:hypothetical protein PoB_003124800 [Plakobranchus ocellatus]|uniref:Uncharacterized protein n=1 Tax=Plakobranchus ocellatus TaxID=259542 RepID=A0AAV4AD96_9GAST|nr:hypothetical protein PoB_003124800 [Plakobranchus ocellatus]
MSMAHFWLLLCHVSSSSHNESGSPSKSEIGDSDVQNQPESSAVGFPVGVQVASMPFQEEIILRVMKALEQFRGDSVPFLTEANHQQTGHGELSFSGRKLRPLLQNSVNNEDPTSRDSGSSSYHSAEGSPLKSGSLIKDPDLSLVLEPTEYDEREGALASKYSKQGNILNEESNRAMSKMEQGQGGFVNSESNIQPESKGNGSKKGSDSGLVFIEPDKESGSGSKRADDQIFIKKQSSTTVTVDVLLEDV